MSAEEGKNLGTNLFQRFKLALKKKHGDPLGRDSFEQRYQQLERELSKLLEAANDVAVETDANTVAALNAAIRRGKVTLLTEKVPELKQSARRGRGVSNCLIAERQEQIANLIERVCAVPYGTAAASAGTGTSSSTGARPLATVSAKSSKPGKQVADAGGATYYNAAFSSSPSPGGPACGTEAVGSLEEGPGGPDNDCQAGVQDQDPDSADRGGRPLEGGDAFPLRTGKLPQDLTDMDGGNAGSAGSPAERAGYCLVHLAEAAGAAGAAAGGAVAVRTPKKKWA